MREAATAKIKYIKDAKGRWHWKLTGKNGRIVAIDQDGFSTKQNAEDGPRSAMRILNGLYGLDFQYREVTREVPVPATVRPAFWRFQGAFVGMGLVLIAMAIF